MNYSVHRRLVVWLGAALVAAAGAPALARAGDAPEEPVSIRGACVAVLQDTLIVAGGVQELPAGDDLSQAKFSDAIYILPAGDRARKQEWKKAKTKLPVPMAFAAATVAEDGLVIIGGWTAQGPTDRVLRGVLSGGKDDVVLSEYVKPAEPPFGQPVGKTLKVEFQPLGAGDAYYPMLPEKLAFCAARTLANRIYVVGGCTLGADGRVLASNRVHELKLAKADVAAGKAAVRQWTLVPMENPPMNPDRGVKAPLGSGALWPMLEVRRDEMALKDALFVMGGWEPDQASGAFRYRAASWRLIPGDYDPQATFFREFENSRCGWFENKLLPAGLQLQTSAPVGPAHMLVHAQKDGPATKTLKELAGGRTGSNLYLYHVLTGAWVEQSADAQRRTGQLVQFGGGFAWLDASGQVTALTGKPEAWGSRVEYASKRFGWVDFTVIALYLAFMIGIGEYFRRADKNTKDYFLGGQRIPWWAAGLSIWATGVSAISYMAIPAKTYMMDWSYVSLGLWPVLTTLIVAYVFIPMLRKLEIVTIMEYFQMRFGKSIRIASTVFMVIGSIGGRMSVVLLLPSLALSAVTGWDVYLCILAMGVVTTIYTVTGGMNAVVWTDVAQTVVMFGGAILSFLLVVFQVEGGLGGMVQVAMNDHKLRMFDWTWDLTVASFWTFFLWALVDIWGKLGQEGLQRAFSTKDAASARKAMITCALVSVPGTILFYGIGTALYAFYHQHPQDLNPNIPNDGIFPLFIMQQLPTGVAGLIIAGIFAAAMSTLSGMNSVATVIVRDYYAFLKPDAPEDHRLFTARWITLLLGVLAIAGACVLASWKLGSVWDTFSEAMALLGGGFGCVMVLGLLTRRANTFGVWVGILAGTAFLWSLKLFKVPMSFFIYGTVTTVFACAVGYLASFLSTEEPKDLTGLTLWTLRKDKKADEAAQAGAS